MTKTRKNYAMRISAILMILTMTSLCMVSGTFAKYTTKKDGTDTATVAKFAFNLNGTDLPTASSIDVNLFKNSYLNGKVSGTTGNVVAPGTSGTFAIETENTGEVAVTTNFTFEETNNNSIPIKYAVTDSETAPEAGDEAWKAATDATITGASLAVRAPATPQYVHWMWVTDTDAADTTLGTASALATVTTKITCTVAQDTSVA